MTVRLYDGRGAERGVVPSDPVLQIRLQGGTNSPVGAEAHPPHESEGELAELPRGRRGGGRQEAARLEGRRDRLRVARRSAKKPLEPAGLVDGSASVPACAEGRALTFPADPRHAARVIRSSRSTARPRPDMAIRSQLGAARAAARLCRAYALPQRRSVERPPDIGARRVISPASACLRAGARAVVRRMAAGRGLCSAAGEGRALRRGSAVAPRACACSWVCGLQVSCTSR